MDSTDWLITATITGPILAALLSPGIARGLRSVATARAQRVRHVPASGTDLYSRGVPLSEAQFREAYAAMQSELDELPPPAERTDWEFKRQYDAVNRLSMLAGTFPQAFPMLGSANQAWEWYATYGPYAKPVFPDTASHAVATRTGRRLGRWPRPRSARRSTPRAD